MRLADLPVVGDLLESGAEDRIFDSLLLAGPVLILVIVRFGRSAVTTALAASYVLFFVAYVLYRGARH